MRVHIDDARQHQQPGRIDHLVGARQEPRQIAIDGDDPPTIDGQVRAPGTRRGDDGPAMDDEVRHARGPVMPRVRVIETPLQSPHPSLW